MRKFGENKDQTIEEQVGWSLGEPHIVSAAALGRTILRMVLASGKKDKYIFWCGPMQRICCLNIQHIKPMLLVKFVHKI